MELMATDIPTKQRAWMVVGRDVPRKAMKFVEDAEVPSKLKPGDVLIKVQAAALNPACVQFCVVSAQKCSRTITITWYM